MNDINNYENAILKMSIDDLIKEFRSVQALRQYAYDLVSKQPHTFLTRKDTEGYSIILETNAKIDKIIKVMNNK